MAHVNLRPDATNLISPTIAGTVVSLRNALVKLFKYSVIGKVQGADQTLTSATGTTLQDSELILPVKKGRKYRIEGKIFTTGTSATPGMKACLTHTGQTSPTLYGSLTFVSATALLNEAMTTGTTTGGATAYRHIDIDGYFIPDGNGTIKFQFAQNTSNAASTVVKAGSWLKLFEA
jgi:hypothetical protein